jgi:phenylpyruvate tautomerase PptA (4-oxalocrotonate tautomerase family)
MTQNLPPAGRTRGRKWLSFELIKLRRDVVRMAAEYPAHAVFDLVLPTRSCHMPLFTVTMRSGRTAAEKDAISAAIHEASVGSGYPDDDLFQRFISFDDSDLRISPRYPDLQKPRSEHFLLIEALLSSGTEAARKRLLLSEIVTRLQAAGTDPNDVMVLFGEIDRGNSSFGGGRVALPVEVRPAV